MPIILNSDLIEHIESTPDTVITLVSGQKYMVLESVDEIVERVVKFRHSLLRNQPFRPTHVPGGRSVTAIGVGETPSHG